MAIVLYGSGEFTDSVNQIDQSLIDQFNPKSVAVVPTAAGQEKDWFKWLDMAENHFNKFNIEVIKIAVTNQKEANDPSIVNNILKADWIFYSGGQPDYLFKTINHSLLWQITLERYKSGVLLAGSSAGAMILGNYILDKPFKAMLQKTDENWQKTFGLVDYTILPHFNRMNQFRPLLNQLLKNAPKSISENLIGIDEDTALLIENNNMKKLGQGNVELRQKDKTSTL